VTFGDKNTFSETSIAAPALAVFDGDLAVAWTGTNSAHNLNVGYLPA
jgi:hypothetical protein